MFSYTSCTGNNILNIALSGNNIKIVSSAGIIPENLLQDILSHYSYAKETVPHDLI